MQRNPPIIRLAIVGFGAVASEVYTPILKHLPIAQVTAIADANDERRALAARAFPSARLSNSHQSLFAAEGIDAVLIATPPAQHAEAAIVAWENGVHVHVEKPAASTRKDADRMVSAWRAAKGPLATVGFNYRFHPHHETLRQWLQEGRLGRVISFRYTFSTPPRILPEWKIGSSAGGGVLLDLASHGADLIRYLLGQEIASVSCLLRSVITEADTAIVTACLSNGVIGTIECSHSSHEQGTIEIVGTRGSVLVDRYRTMVPRITGVGVEGLAARLTAPLRELKGLGYWMRRQRQPWCEPSFARSLKVFLRNCAGEHIPHPTLDDGWHSLAVILAAEESARTGRPQIPALQLSTQRPTESESPTR